MRASNAAFSELVNLHVFLYFQLYSVFLLFYCICPVAFCHRAKIVSATVLKGGLSEKFQSPSGVVKHA